MSEVDVKKSVKQDRRVFLQTAAKVAGVMTALGLTTELLSETHASAQDQKGTFFEHKVKITPEMKAVASLFNELLANKDPNGALRKYQAEAKLSPAQISAVKLLTREDLMTLDTVRRKMGPLSKGDTNGFIIY